MSTLSITVIQSSLHWENKAANLLMLEEKINSIGERTEVVVLPEMFSTGFTMNAAALAESMNGPTIDWMKRISHAHRIILTGSLIIEEDGKYHNRLIWMMPNGETGYYDKRHLFGFAGENESYHPGNKRLIASVKGWKINLQICYDLRFPVWARQQINPSAEPGSDPAEYDVLIYVANWPQRRSHAWKTLLCARAIENQCYVVGVNRVGDDGNGILHSGDSMVVDPMGEVLFTQANEAIAKTFTLEKSVLEQVREKLPFLRDRDPFTIG